MEMVNLSIPTNNRVMIITMLIDLVQFVHITQLIHVIRYDQINRYQFEHLMRLLFVHW